MEPDITHYARERDYWDARGLSEYRSLSVVDRERIQRWIGWPGHGRTLDLGGGSGMVSRLLAAAPCTECVCTDISRAMLIHATVPAVQSDALALPFRDAAFDLVVAAALFHHLPDSHDRLLAECARILRPGGRLVGYDPNGQCIQNRLFMTDSPLRLSLFSPDERPIRPADLESASARAGFSGFRHSVFSFRNARLTAFEAIQRYALSPIAIGPLASLLERWFFWEATR